MPDIDMFNLIWSEMQKERARVNGEFIKLKTQLDAGLTPIQQALADLPLAADGMNSPERRWCTDCRKDGEGAGLGTGIWVYYNSNDDTWKRFSDDTTAAT